MAQATREEIEAYAQYLASNGANPDEVNQYKAYLYNESGIKPETDFWASAKDGALTALDYGLRGLDYAGGLTRTAAAQLADPLTENNLVTVDDWKSALMGKAPNTAQYMDRAGISEGAKVNVPLLGEVSARDVGGFIGDVALDPLTYVSLGASAAAKKGAQGALARSGKALNVAGKGAERVGDSIYRSGFKKVDEGLIEKGLKPFSQVMIEHGRPTGTMKAMAKKAGAINDRLMDERQGIYNLIEATGERADMLRAMNTASDEIAEMVRRNPGLAKKAESLEDWVLSYGRDGDLVPVSTASDWKTSLYESLPDSAYGPNGRVSAPAKQVEKAFARGLKESIEEAGEKAGGKKMGQRITNINEDVGSIINAKKPMAREIRKGNSKNVVTAVDAPLVAWSFAEPISGTLALTGKKLVDLSKTTWARTKAGKGINALGQSGLIDPAIRQFLVEQNRSPWEGVGN